MNVNETTVLQFAGAANPFTPTPSPTPATAASPPPRYYLQKGQTLYKDDQPVQSVPDWLQSTPLAISGDVLPPGYSIRDTQHHVLLAAPKDGVPVALSMLPATPTPTATGGSGGATTPQPATVLNVDRENVVSVAATPTIVAQSGSRVTLGFTATGRQPGYAKVTIGNGKASCVYTIAVVPGTGAARALVFSSGFGGSNIPAHTVVTVTPSPLPGGVAGQSVYFSEHSAGQTFVPVLANYRITNQPWPVQLYVSGGLAATSGSGKVLYGVSLGLEDKLFLTGGWHSTTVDMLQPGVVANGFTPYTTFPAGVTPTFSQRTTRPFIALTFPLCSIASIFSGLGLTCPSTPTPTPTSTPSPTPAAH
ncbi:MAG: hypothetical protein JO103_04955 [Candidatus Eremiobacteraeota bacterium]|nr:hypothetical protein [Candidatus Eremiobacteraeota bacterium]